MLNCIFCRIVRGEIPSFKVLENEHVLAFMDVNPLAKNHVLVVPKDHAEKLHEVGDKQMAAVGVALKQVALAIGAKDYNILQNNGRIAHQEVDHVHFHVIPKTASEGLVIGSWQKVETSMDSLSQLGQDLQQKISQLSSK